MLMIPTMMPAAAPIRMMSSETRPVSITAISICGMLSALAAVAEDQRQHHQDDGRDDRGLLRRQAAVISG